MLRSAVEFQAVSPLGLPGALWHASRYWTAPVPLAQVAENETAGSALDVYVSHGRWVVDCPDCSSAQLACLTDPRFMCSECANTRNGHKFRPTTVPPDDVRAQIEMILMWRPTVNRNWYPHETIQQLRDENLANGVRAV